MFSGIFVVLLILFIGLWSFTMSHRHLLITLLRLEFVALNLFLLAFFIFYGINQETYVCLLLLTIFVCEGRLSLGVLVSIIRTHGNDYLNSIIALQC